MERAKTEGVVSGGGAVKKRAEPDQVVTCCGGFKHHKANDEAFYAKIQARIRRHKALLVWSKKERTKKVRVSQVTIDHLLCHPPLKHCPLLPDEKAELDRLPPTLRDRFPKTAAFTEKLVSFKRDIIEQYQAKGYAETEVLISDDEAEAAAQKKEETGMVDGNKGS